MKTLTLKFNDDLVIKVKPFSDEIDIDKLLVTNPKKIAVEILIFPTLLNKLGLMLEDFKNKQKERQIDFEAYEALKTEKIRKEYNEMKSLGERLTQDDIKIGSKADLLSDPGYKTRQKLLLKAEKEVGYVSSIYWAAKEKSENIRKLGDKLRPEDFDIEYLEGEIHNFEVFIGQPLIK